MSSSRRRTGFVREKVSRSRCTRMFARLPAGRRDSASAVRATTPLRRTQPHQCSNLVSPLFRFSISNVPHLFQNVKSLAPRHRASGTPVLDSAYRTGRAAQFFKKCGCCLFGCYRGISVHREVITSKCFPRLYASAPRRDGLQGKILQCRAR